MNKNRDDFLSKTKDQIAKSAGWLCCDPACRAHTVGATADGKAIVNLGVAAHICAAAPGGPRYDEMMTTEERRSADNGIWLCSNHSKAVDSDPNKFTVELLKDWKKKALDDSWRRVLQNEASSAVEDRSNDDLYAQLRSFAESDLAIFRNSSKWAKTSVALTLRVVGQEAAATTTALASAVRTLEDLILIAPPGMGKTTTLFQIAEGILSSDTGIPIVLPLGDWATENISILNSCLKRHSFHNFTEDNFRTVATKPGVVILLDGWNELDANSRQRARVQIESLKAELPEVGFVISTRKQILDVPFSGKIVELMPLSDDQQIEIAKAIRGEMGLRIVDQAWRTTGIRELVPIPLYLSALLALPDGESFPTTKEEVLRWFVSAHENDPRRAEALYDVVGQFQSNYLQNLAVCATRLGNTTITDIDARRSISETSKLLVSDGQISVAPDPTKVMEVFFNSHLLVRAGETPGMSFQHQQFQEWYTSHYVESRIVAGLSSTAETNSLKTDILNLPIWEEAILFAIERMSRKQSADQIACSITILAAFDADPMLAAEMIFRATDEVWRLVALPLQDKIDRWHQTGVPDRAFRFMMNSGRSEFLERLWPLISHEDESISLTALRNCRSFRPSLLGTDAVMRVKNLSQRPRMVLLEEISSQSGMDGLDLATLIAKNDPSPEIQASVIEALTFRRADRHVTEILENAPDATFDLVALNNFSDHIGDDHVRQGIAAARRRHKEDTTSLYKQLRTIVLAKDNEDRGIELADIISEMEVEQLHDAAVQLVYQARSRYPRAVIDGLLSRVRTNHSLFYGIADILATSGLGLEDEELLQIALAATPIRDDRAEAAASVLGPEAVGKMIDALAEVAAQFHVTDGVSNQAVADRYDCIQSRISHVAGAHLVMAIEKRATQADNDQIAHFCNLLSRHSPGETGRARPFNADSLLRIQSLAKNWGNRLLNSGDAKRRQLTSVALLATRAPSVSLLPILKKLLNENLRQYQIFREEAHATCWRPSSAVDEARSPQTHEYQRAFVQIDAPETALLMGEYLSNPYFGPLAAQVLSSNWYAKNAPPRTNLLFSGTDFRNVGERRNARLTNPVATSTEAEAIFEVVEQLFSENPTSEQTQLALELGVVAASLPHGQRTRTIAQLVEDTPRRGRAKLLLNLILSGEEVDAEHVIRGINETFEAAKAARWILEQSNGYELREWLILLPFITRPAELLEVVRNMPDAQRTPDFLEDMVENLAVTPSVGGESVFFALAEHDPRFYRNYRWCATALRFGTESAASRIMDLTINGVFNTRSFDTWHWARELGSLIKRFPHIREKAYDLLKDPSRYDTQIARAVAENPDVEGLLLLVGINNEDASRLVGRHLIERVVCDFVPVEDWGGAFNIVPRAVPALRQRLLAMMTDEQSTHAAAKCLHAIDKIRDEHGVPLLEPRHPDILSGKVWPRMTSDTEAFMD